MICETLQSELNNFTAEFFGPVTKTDGAPGVVHWELPCGLDIGLPSNPRGFDEGVSCYFLRLFRDVIEQYSGAAGASGNPGANGYSGYTVSLSSFSQPSSAAPLLALRALLNPVIKVNEIVYVDRSGWYQVLGIDPVGNLTLSLIQPMLGASGTIPAGRVIVPVGPKGQDQTGPAGNLGQPGLKGIKGPTGGAGADGANGSSLMHGATEVNGSFIGKYPMTPYKVTSKSNVVYFYTPDKVPIPKPPPPPLTDAQIAARAAATVSFKLTSAGRYLFRMVSLYNASSDGAVLYTGLADTTTPANNISPDPAGTYKFLPGSYTNSKQLSAGTQGQISQSCIVETSVNYTTIEWQAFGNSCSVDPVWTTITWVRIT